MPPNKKSKSRKSAEENSKQHVIELKDHVDPVVRRCIAENYNQGPMGYLIMVGGEALNYHLPKNRQVQTADYDLKFVVSPRYTDDEENLRRANVKRLHIIQNLLKCLSHVKPPKGYKKLYPRLTLLFQDSVRELRIEGSKIFMIHPETGEERPFYYRYNKVFTLKLVYQPENNKTSKKTIEEELPLDEFTLIDIGLYYRLPENEPFYNFMTNRIYNTFLEPPFSRPIPVPFDVEDNNGQKIRYPILPYILVDNFRMLLFANDFLHIYKDNQSKIEFFQDKLKGYHRKMNIVLDEFSKTSKRRKIISTRQNSDIVKDIKTQINRTVKLYEPLAALNALCYREEGKYYYTTELQKHQKCDQKYLDNLDEFYDEYYKTLNLISELMPPYEPNIKRSRSRNR